ncbi:hypothetical protein CRD36_17280 [Paremcibacter congregatus]|uniref:Uncharacterized protein n=1 Tax=Paremcibacter congregatus TaxID=2043170 RepID=A0A2G4YLY9_9PROT|nr:hypothetical protein CRD36_17280 [Paremcibacter congregatus]
MIEKGCFGILFLWLLSSAAYHPLPCINPWFIPVRVQRQKSVTISSLFSIRDKQDLKSAPDQVQVGDNYKGWEFQA